MSLEWRRPDCRRGQSRVGGCRGDRTFHSKDVHPADLKHRLATPKQNPKITTAVPVRQGQNFQSRHCNSEVPVKSSQPKSEVPPAASGLLPPPFSSGFSHFPHLLLTFRSRLSILQPASSTSSNSCIFTCANHPIGFNSIGIGISHLVARVSPSSSYPVASLASPARRCSFLLSVAVCTYLAKVPSSFAETKVAIVLSIYSRPSRLGRFIVLGRPPPTLTGFYYPSMPR